MVIVSLEGYLISLPLLEGTGRIRPDARVACGRQAPRRATPFACARSPSVRKWQRARRKACHRCTPYELSQSPLFTLLLPSKRRSTLSSGAGHCSTRSRSQPLASRGALALSSPKPTLHGNVDLAKTLDCTQIILVPQSGSACPCGTECA
jgi:hypothetical protein